VVIRSVFANNTSAHRQELKAEIIEKEESLNQMQDLKIKVTEKITKNNTINEVKIKIESIENAITALKSDLINLNDKLNIKCKFASKAKWYEQGEKSNKFFLNLTKLRQSQTLIASIKNKDKEYKGQEEVTTGITEFYKKLYKKNCKEDNSQDDTFYDKCPKLLPQNKAYMEDDLTIEELHKALLTCTESSPGPDGIPYIVYKNFWKITGPIILNHRGYII